MDMDKTLVYSVVNRGKGMGSDALQEKLSKMAGVTNVTASDSEGRVFVSGPNPNPTVFEQAITQAGYEVLFVTE